MLKRYTIVLLTGFALAGTTAGAETPADFLQVFEREARTQTPDFDGFSADRGRTFFTTPQSQDWSCASCHTDNPLAQGSHTVTGKAIKPLAPAANPERFTSTRKVEKWFRRNCNDVLDRACTAREKGDVLTYLLSLKP